MTGNNVFITTIRTQKMAKAIVLLLALALIAAIIVGLFAFAPGKQSAEARNALPFLIAIAMVSGMTGLYLRFTAAKRLVLTTDRQGDITLMIFELGKGKTQVARSPFILHFGYSMYEAHYNSPGSVAMNVVFRDEDSRALLSLFDSRSKVSLPGYWRQKPPGWSDGCQNQHECRDLVKLVEQLKEAGAIKGGG
jgi:uncharacterized SAM-binding protein YcdF (DUF218 family)